jgi:5'-nucleotidase
MGTTMTDQAHRPLLLVTNDDGIEAPGLRVLAEHLAEEAEVLVVAPSRERSAVGHGLTLTQPLRVRRRGDGRHAVNGTPADAVLLGIAEICPRRPDLVVSGINPGVNLGTDVFYSGTVAGAMEGAIRGIQALAVSQDLPRDDGGPGMEPLVLRTARFAAALVRRLLERPLPGATVLNVNAPATLSESYAWTRLGRRVYREKVERRLDPRGRPYFWIGGPAMENVSPPGTDAHAVEGGAISVTPLGLNLYTELPGAEQHYPVDGYRLLEPG